MRKLNDENKELAQTLKKDSDLQRRPAAPKSASNKKKAGGSDRSSNRGSEERQSSLPAGGRGQKRGRDYELEKVCSNSSIRFSSPLPEMEPIFPGLVSRPYGKDTSNQVMEGEVEPTAEAIEPPVPVPASGENCNPSMFWERQAPKIAFPEVVITSSRILRSRKPKVKERARQGSVAVSSRHWTRPASRKGLATETVDEILARSPPPERPVILESGWLTEYPDYPALATAFKQDNIHPQLKTLNIHDPGNIAKRHFFQGQDPKAKLMIAGVPRDGGLHPIRSEPSKTSKSAKMPGFPIRQPQPVTEGHPSVEIATAVLQDMYEAAIDDDNQEETFLGRPSISIPCPDHLKSILVDDWENVTKNLLLVPLPSKTPANKILDTYYEEEKVKRRPGSAEADLLDEVVAGVKDYFENALGRILLYRFEREQYHEVRQLWEGAVGGEWEGKGPGDVYGAEHMARLFGTSITVSVARFVSQPEKKL